MPRDYRRAENHAKDQKPTIPCIALIIFLSLELVPERLLCADFGEGDLRWRWFSALSLKNNWRILEGSADVVAKDGKLRAELFDTSGFHRITIKGSIENDEIKAVAIRHGTDDEPRRLSGMMSRTNWGRSSILLFEKYAGGLVIGITRE
jgi:hypothetical protein